MNKNLWKKIGIIASCFLGVGLISIPFILIGVTQSQNKYNFVMGNYDDYIAPEVADTFYNEYGLTINTYLASEEVAQGFEKNTMDCAIVPTYEAINLYNRGLIKKVDWSRFNIKGISDANSAKSLFWSLPNAMLQNNNQHLNLLEWSIPYFCQDLVFVYRGSAIPALENATNWASVMNVIKSEPRFNAKKMNSKLPLIGLIDDQRTLYSLSSIINNSSNITPKNDATIDELQQGYSYLENKFVEYPNWAILFSDSNTLLNKIANRELMGAIVYNGDAMYASWGGDVCPDTVANENDFHVVKLSNTLLALDTIVINKNINDDTLDKFYRMVNQLCLTFNPANVDDTGTPNDISYLNFDYVGYTPSLASLYNYIKTPGNYFETSVQEKIFNINVPANMVNASNLENPINTLTRSNLAFAYIWLKSNIGS